jgi:membrane-bound metal-dependent hydrolase YbcI (DUF457 family)
MPMTPWHLGPGLAFKAVAGPRMSLLTFAIAQPVMDVEPIYRILNQLPRPHGASHTFVGAIALAGATVGITVPLVRLVGGKKSAWLNFNWRAAWCGSLLGTLSHVVLDSIMHTDVQPFWPVPSVSPLHGAMGLTALHDLCFWSGSVGAIAWGVTAGYRRWLSRHAGDAHGRDPNPDADRRAD